MFYLYRITATSEARLIFKSIEEASESLQRSSDRNGMIVPTLYVMGNVELDETSLIVLRNQLNEY